jgi:hypothetical protein
MPDLTLLLQHGLLYGVIPSVFMVLAFVGAAYLNPEIWLPDYPPGIGERFGPMSERAKQQRRLVGIPVFLLLSVVLVLSRVRLAQIGSEAVFFSVFFGTFIVYDHSRPRSVPAITTANRRNICIARTSGTSAPLPKAMIATESIPPGVAAR